MVRALNAQDPTTPHALTDPILTRGAREKKRPTYEKDPTTYRRLRESALLSGDKHITPEELEAQLASVKDFREREIREKLQINEATEWYIPFLAALRNSANLRVACDAAGHSRSYVQEHRAKYPAFARVWDEAIEDAIDILEAEAWQRARTQSDPMLTFLMKHKRPEVYNPAKHVEHSGPGGSAISLTLIDSVLSDYDDTPADDDPRLIDADYEALPAADDAAP